LTIRVLKPGLSTTVQAAGRYGYAHLGISPCGAADMLSLRIANLLVGNDQYAPALEMTLLGATLEFESDLLIAVSGAGCDCKVEQATIALNTTVRVKAGSVLQCGSTSNAARVYLAVHGGLNVPLVMESASTDVRGSFGGFEGRRLKAGDRLQVGAPTTALPKQLRAGALGELRTDGPIRVTRGAQHDWFSSDEYEKFLATSYTVSEQSDRAGLRLKGEPVTQLQPRQLLTDGIPLGAIQVPQDGQPIILFVDQQTTGGYPKIANIVTADMYRVGQLRPRESLRFAEVSIPDAIDALRTRENWLKSIWQE
jgi:biotin-dependent carboxylase-like uncharacterized protein